MNAADDQDARLAKDLGRYASHPRLAVWLEKIRGRQELV
jgi:hypothetical protein